MQAGCIPPLTPEIYWQPRGVFQQMFTASRGIPTALEGLSTQEGLMTAQGPDSRSKHTIFILSFL